MTSSTGQQESAELVSLASLQNDFSDRWNPILVRELRRSLKSRSFGLTFPLLLFGNLALSFFMTLSAANSSDLASLGRSLYITYFGMLAVAIQGVVPLFLFSSIAQERSGNTLEMVAISQLHSFRIVDGYLWNGFAQSILYGSSIVPFLAFSYLFGGFGPVALIVSVFCFLIFTINMLLWGVSLGSLVRGPISLTLCTLLVIAGGFLNIAFSSGFISALTDYETDYIEMAQAIPFLVCPGIFVFVIWAILYGTAEHNMTMYDQTQKPYRVELGDSPDSIKFKH